MQRHETIIHTMDEGDLKYLTVSNVTYPDVCQYPDSGKTLVSHRWNNGGEDDERQYRVNLWLKPTGLH